MADVITVTGLVVSGVCGALPEEQLRAQPFRIDLAIAADLTAAATSDRLADTVDYGAVCAAVGDLVSTGRFTLMEAMAGRIADLVLSRPLVESVTVSVTKLRPPVPEVLESSGVTMTRRVAGE